MCVTSETQCIRGWGKEDSTTGYLRVSLDNKVYYAHRLAYMSANGAIPYGYHIHHKCDNKTCVNPNHLIAVTADEHNHIHVKPKSNEYFSNLKFCKNGHEFDGIRNNKDGKTSRTCSTCKRKRSKEWARRNKEKRSVTFKKWYYTNKEIHHVVH